MKRREIFAGFEKPYFDVFLAKHPGWGKSQKTTAVPLLFPLESLFRQNNNIFDAIIMDTGGFLLTQDLLGSHINKAFLKRRRYQTWNGVKYPEGNERYVWHTRLYFLLPLAHEFYRTGDEQYVKRWFRLFRNWRKKNPVPADPEEHYRKRQNKQWFAWFDMQPTWRVIVLIHSVYMLRNTRSLSAANWIEIHAAIVETIDYLYRYYRNKGFLKGNHHLQQGTALILTGVLYPELKQAKQYLNLGRRIVSEHWRREVFSDGGLREVAGSYNHFIASLFRDSFLFCKNNGVPPPKGMDMTGLRRIFTFLSATSTKAGLSFPFSNSYWCDWSGHFDFLAKQKLLPKDILRKIHNRSMLFPETNVAVVRQNNVTLFADGTRPYTGHWHQGMLGFSLFFRGKPIIADTGCWNYDTRIHHNWFRQPCAQNTILVDGMPYFGKTENGFDWLYPLRIKPIQMHTIRNGAEIVMEAIAQDKPQYCWTRKLRLLNSGMLLDVMDTITSTHEITCELFLLPHVPLMNLSVTGYTAGLQGGHQIKIESGILQQRMGWILTENNVIKRMTYLRVVKQGQIVSFHTSIHISG